MKLWAIVTFATALLGLCSCAQNGHSISSLGFPDILNPEVPTVIVQNGLRNSTIASSISGLIDRLNQTASDASASISHAFGNSGQDVVNIIVNPIQNLIRRIQAFLTQLLKSVQSTIGESTKVRIRRTAPELISFLSGWKGRGNNLSANLKAWMDAIDERNQVKHFLRKRRSTLSGLQNVVSSVLPDVVSYPVQFVSNLPTALQNITNSGVSKILLETAKVLGHFLSTTAVPYSYRFLNGLDQSVNLPSFLHILIQNFNVVYNLAKLLGYVS